MMKMHKQNIQQPTVRESGLVLGARGSVGFAATTADASDAPPGRTRLE